MSSPALGSDRLQHEEWARLGAALAALARRAPAPRKRPQLTEREPVLAASHRAPAPHTPWTRRSRPLYKF